MFKRSAEKDPVATTARLHRETPDCGNPFRARYLGELKALIRSRQALARKDRERRFRPDFTSEKAYVRSLLPFRKEFLGMLGWPLNEPALQRGVPKPVIRKVATDSLGLIFRLRVPILPRLSMYGMLFVPNNPDSKVFLNRPSQITHRKYPLVICQHGGLGTPERIAGFFDSANYNDMLRRVLVHRVIVFAPQLLLWAPEFGPKFQRQQTDGFLKALGGSITALEIHGIRRCLDYLVTRSDVDTRRIGMLGLSYGGFFSLYTAAAEPRIKTVLASCSFSRRDERVGGDWSWKGVANQFMDGEVAGLICPRPLFLEAGRKDALIPAKRARQEAPRAMRYYRKLGVEDRFRFRVFNGGHEFCKDDKGIRFFMESLMR